MSKSLKSDFCSTGPSVEKFERRGICKQQVVVNMAVSIAILATFKLLLLFSPNFSTKDQLKKSLFEDLIFLRQISFQMFSSFNVDLQIILILKPLSKIFHFRPLSVIICIALLSMSTLLTAADPLLTLVNARNVNVIR